MQAIATLADWIDLLSIVLLMVGLVLSLISAVRAATQAHGEFLESLSGPVLRIFRMTLGRWILVALEVLIVSDILHSIAHRTLDEIAFLAGTVVIRVTLAFFLDHEIRYLGMADGAGKGDASGKDKDRSAE